LAHIGETLVFHQVTTLFGSSTVYLLPLEHAAPSAADAAAIVTT